MWYIYKIILLKLKKKFEGNFIGSLEISFPNNRIFRFGSSSKISRIKVKNNLFLFKLLFLGVPYIGHGYFKGDWVTENLKELLALGIKNKKLLNSIPVFNIFLYIITKISKIFESNTLKKSKSQIGFHYDLGNNFYNLWLDKSMTYSSALFKKSKTLEKAQNNKYKNLAQETNIKKNNTVLEIGCGWGGFVKYVNDNIGAKITGITISKKQFDYAKKNKNKLTNIELLDYRKVKKTYDKIISIEMFEAVGKKNWNIFFKTLNNLLNKNGQAGLQIITISEPNYSYYLQRRDFIQKYIFPGGMLPTKKILNRLALQNNLLIKECKSFSQDYAKTLALWRKNFIANWDKIEKLGFDKNFKRLWEYYLCYCEVGFKTGVIEVSQFILKKGKE